MRTAVRAAFAILIFLEALAPFVFTNVASDFTWLGLIVTAAFAWGVLELFRSSTFVLWIGWAAILLDGASALLELYSKIEPWDLWIHTFGGAMIAVAALDLIRRALKKGHVAARRQGPFVAAAIYLITATVGFLYEFWEYLVDKIQYGYPKSLVSAYDSIEDQLFNLLGATVVLVIYFLWKARANRRASR